MASRPDDRFEPFILKVDIEGAEKALFNQDWDLLDRFGVVVMESHDFMLPGQLTSSSFFAFHSSHRRDFLYNRENLFSIAYERLAAPSTLGKSGDSTSVLLANQREPARGALVGRASERYGLPL